MALNDVPQPSQTLASTQNPIRTNFATIDTAFTIDHAPYGSGNQGMHNKVTLPVLGAAPVYAAGNSGFFNLAVAGVNEVFINKQAHAGVQQVPFTASILSFATPGSVTDGWTYLPSGIFLRWGTGNANGLTTVTLTPSPPTQILNVMVCPYTPAVTGYVNVTVRVVDVLSNTQFRVFGSLNDAPGITGFMYMVVGY